VATDYEKYSVVYSCSSIFGLAKAEYVWILTREQNPTEEILTAVNQHISEKIPNYSIDNLYFTIQDGTCQYYQDASNTFVQ
jgi:hypothetical protein